MARTYEEMMARMDELEKAQAAATAAPVPAPPAARVPAAPKPVVAPGMEALPKPSAAPSAPTVTRRAVSVTPKVEEIKAPKPPEVEAPKPVGLTPDLAKPIDYKKVYDAAGTPFVSQALRFAAPDMGMSESELQRIAQAQGVDLDAIVKARQKGRTYDEIAKAGRERGVIGFMPVEEREKAFNKLAQDVEKAQRGDAGDTVELVRSGADKGFGVAGALGGYTFAGTQAELPEVAKPGEHGYAVAQILVDALQKDPSAVRAFDLYGRSLATGNTQRYIDDRVEDLRKRANIKASDADAMEKMAALRKRAINEVIAYKTVGQWTPVVTLGDVEVREGRASPGVLDALKPNIEIIGFNNKRQAIFRQESPMGVLFRAIDVPQAAIAGVLSGQTVGQGIQSGANLLEYSLDATKDSAMYVKAPVVAAGFAASILFPDALVAAGAAGKAVKAVSKIRAARKIAPEATALLETIVRTRKAGDYEAAAAAEKQLRSLLPDVASNLDSADAAVARFQKLAEPESDILDTDLAALIAGAAPEQARVVAGRPFLHPSLRKFVVGPSGLEQADYAELFDTRRHLDRVQRAKAEYIKARTTGRSVTDYTKDYVRGRVHDVFENLPAERQLSLTQVNRMADLISAQAPAALLDQKQFKKAVEDALKADAEFGTDAYKMARQDAYKAIGGRTETKLDEIRGKTIEELEAADMGLFDRAIKAIEQNNTARGVAAQLLRDEIAGAARLRVEPLELFDEVAPKLSSGEPIRLTPGGLLLLHHLRQAYPKQDFKEAYATITIIDKMIEGAAQAREVSPLALYQEIFPLIKRGTPEDLKRLAGDLKAGKVPTGGAPTGGAPAAPAAPTKAARARAEAKLREMMRRLGDEELDEIEGMLRADGVQEGEAYALDAIKREKQRRAREAKKAAAATPAAAPSVEEQLADVSDEELANAIKALEEGPPGPMLDDLRAEQARRAAKPTPVVVEEVVEAPAAAPTAEAQAPTIAAPPTPAPIAAAAEVQPEAAKIVETPPTPVKRKRATRVKAEAAAPEAAPAPAVKPPDVFPSIEPLARTAPSPWAEVPQRFVVAAETRLRKAAEDLDAGRINVVDYDVRVGDVRKDLTAQKAARDARKAEAPLVRGASEVRAKLLKAQAAGVIDEAGVDLADWLIRQNPRIADDLNVAILTPESAKKRFGVDVGEAVGGFYEPLDRIVALIKERGSEETAVHEILHHTERMLPEALQTAVRDEWAKQLTAALRRATPEQRPLLEKALTGQSSALPQGIGDGTLPRAFYQFSNPSEFWAVNASRIVSGRYAALDKGLIARAKQWLTEFVQKVKSAFKLPSDAPLIRGLDAVLKGEGTFVSKQMISETRDALFPRIEQTAAQVLDELRQTQFISDKQLLDILGDSRPEYLDNVASFILEQRKKVREGRLTVRDVAKAYLPTVASQRAGAIDAARVESILGPLDDRFIVLGKKGQRQVRPEEAMAAWMFSPDGQRALNALERGEFDAEAWETVAALRDIWGNNTLRNSGVFGAPRKGAATMQNLQGVVDEINAAQGDIRKVEAAVRKLNGIGNAKTPFISHLLGFGENPTMDAVEFNGWLTGRADVGALKTKEADLARALKERQDINKIALAMADRAMERFRLLREQGVPGTDMPDEVFGAIMHHWFWDRLKSAETTHAGMYDAMRYAFIEGATPQGDIYRSVEARADALRGYIEPEQRPVAATLFSGGGLVEAGLQNVVRPGYAVEARGDIAAHYGKVFGEHVENVDVRSVDFNKLKDKDIGFLHASPVCKNFSAAKAVNAAGEQALDIETATATARAIDELKPPVFTLENVADYLDSDALRRIEDALTRNGYTFDKNVYNAADYGGATTRKRLIIRAVREGELPPLPTKTGSADWYERVSDLVDDLPSSDMPPFMQRRLEAAGVDWRNLDRPLMVAGGSAWADELPYAFAGGPTFTIKATPNELHRIILPGGDVRAVTPRVLARITGLSDDYPLPATKAAAVTIIGNGIPLELTDAVIAPVIESRAAQVRRVFPSIEAEAPMPSGIPSARAVQTETPAFKAWFGDSKVVDAEGKPLVVYHGTSAAGFDVFRPNYRKGEQLGFGIHFAQDRDFAAKYAEDLKVARKGKSPAVYEVYLSIQRPLVADAIVIEGTPEFTLAKKLAGNNLLTQRNEDGVLMAYMQGAIDKTSAQRAEKLIREAGYDGIVYEAQLAVPTAFGWARDGSSRSYIVFEPTQIKSATANVGTFSPTDPSILKQVSPTGEVKGAVEWLEDGSSVVYLFEGADASTVLHEVAHVVRRNILSNEDMGFIASWVQGLGVNVGHQYGEFTGDAAEIEKAEELFAKAFEQYVAEGKAPAGLEGAFAQLKDAVANVYKAVKDPVIGVELQPEVRRVFDGLFATEPKQADQSLKEAIRRGILGGPEAEVDILTVLSREAKRKGLDQFSPDELATRINEAKANIKQIAKRDPTGTDVVLKFETKVLGKDKWTINDLAAAQAARDARLAPQAEARMALLRDMTGRGRGKAAIYKQDTAVESLWTALSAKETDAPMTKQAKKALRGVASLYFGGSVLEETKMAGQPPAFRRALDTSARIVEQSLADTVALVNDAVATGDDTQLLRYLTGDSDVAKVSGRPILSSGHDKMGAVNRMIQRAIAAFKDDEKEALIELADAINTKDPVERGQKLVTLGFTATGGEVPFKEADEARKAMSDALRRAVGKLLYPEKKDADIGTALAAAIRDSVNAPDKARPSHELRLVETLTYIGGVTARDGDLFKGDSKDMVRTLLGDIRKIYGEIGEESARRVAVQIGAFGGADQAKQFLVRMDLGVDEKTQAAFARFLNGEQPGAENIAGVKRMFDTFGRDIQFVPDAALDVDFYIPRAARERMAQVLSRAQFRTEESVGAADALATSYRYMKTRMTRGNFFIRQRYFMMNTVDHFNAMAYTEGFGIAAASTARVIAQDLLVVPLMREILEVGKAAGVLSPVATERLRSSLQNLGDRAAGRIGKMMSVSKYRIEVNPILEGVDGGFTVGGKVYRYRDIRDIAVEEGVFSSFDTRELQRAILREGQLVLGGPAAKKATVQSRTTGAMLRDGLASLEESVADIAEAWGERERLGAMVTLMEAGYDPRAAAQITVKALFDYSQSMTKLDRHWLVGLLLPFWAFQKNANQQVFNMLFSPWGGYRMMVVKRARERTSDLLGNIMYNTLVDDYGVDVESMPPELQDSYYATIKAFEEAFGPDGPPPEAKRAMRMLLSGRAIDVEGGVLMETSAEIQRLRSAGAFADLARFIPFTVAEPSKAGRSSIMRDRAGFPVPFPRSEGVRAYNALLGDNHSYMELYWPDSTIEAGMKWHTQVAATMFLLSAKGASSTGFTDIPDGGIDEVGWLSVIKPVVDAERSPVLGPLLAGEFTAPPPKRIAAAATPEAWMKVHPMLGKMLDDVYGTTFLRVPAVADPLLVDEDGNLPQLTPDQITEIKRLQEQYPDIGVLKNQRYYLPGGVWATAFENSPLGELNSLLLRWEEEPLESQGRQTIQGKILIWSRKYAGVDVTLTAPSQAAKREEPRKKTETAGTKTF